MNAETLEGIFYLMVISMAVVAFRNFLDLREDRRAQVGDRRYGRWLPPKPWKCRLYKRFGKIAPDRWIRNRL